MALNSLGVGGNTLSAARLDRVLCNLAWREMFESASVSHLPKHQSDHCPLLVRLENRNTTNFRPQFIFQLESLRNGSWGDKRRNEKETSQKEKGLFNSRSPSPCQLGLSHCARRKHYTFHFHTITKWSPPDNSPWPQGLALLMGGADRVKTKIICIPTDYVGDLDMNGMWLPDHLRCPLWIWKC